MYLLSRAVQNHVCFCGIHSQRTVRHGGLDDVLPACADECCRLLFCEIFPRGCSMWAHHVYSGYIVKPQYLMGSGTQLCQSAGSQLPAIPGSPPTSQRGSPNLKASQDAPGLLSPGPSLRSGVSTSRPADLRHLPTAHAPFLAAAAAAAAAEEQRRGGSR